jgi:N6-L-threonylcarbamoyladenine synthase
MIILGIETSCDETAASVVEGKGDSVKVLSNVVSSQIEIHKKYNGVVPEIAAREHILNILPVINEALKKGGIKTPRPRGASTPLERGFSKIDAIAVTVGPGLITSLLVGVETARTLSYVWKIPLVAINHIEGHIYANFITSPLPAVALAKAGHPSPYKEEGEIKFPALILTVSGGHTMLVLMKSHGKFQTIGETRDDAAGEAFDKAAKLMKLGYPGGPIVSKMAAEFKTSPLSAVALAKAGQPSPYQGEGGGTPSPSQGEGWDEVNFAADKIVLPRPMLHDPNFDFSFSGLKTALLYKIQKDKNWQNRVPEYCHEFERAVVETLVGKAIKASKKYKAKTMMLSGGVSANLVLREEFQNAAAKLSIACHIPPMEYTTDNAAMIAATGYFRAKKKNYTAWQKIKADSNLEF